MNVAVLDLAEAEAEAADVNVGEDEQGCRIELNAFLQASCSLYCSVYPKEGSEVDVVGVAECTWVAG